MAAAKKRATARRQSLSAYVCTLIYNDLGCELYATNQPAVPTPLAEKEAA